jgi:hypothetical protein
MPVYYAGWVRGDASIKFGGGFSVVRFQLTGSYKISVPAPAGALTPATVVTPVGAGVMARVVSTVKDLSTKTFVVEVEFHDTTGAFVDSEFTFIALARSS